MQTNDEAQAKAAALQALDKQIAEFNEEHRMIQEAAAKFTVYMQKNSITVYNDATLAYLRHLIKDEDNKVQMGGDDTRLEALKKEMEQYKAYVEIISKARERGVPGAVPDEKGVSKITQDLYCMKHYGKDLKRVADTVSRAYAATFRETAYHVRPKHYWMRAQQRRHQNRHSTTNGNQTYSSMLNIGLPSFQSTSTRRLNTGPRATLRERITSNTGGPSPRNSWQAAYTPHEQKNNVTSEKPKTKSYLPFDDEITPIQPMRQTNNEHTPPVSEKRKSSNQRHENDDAKI